MPAILMLAGCATPSAPAADGEPPLAFARVGERVYVDGPEITPVDLLEDSRCPALAQCVWAGRVRIAARIHLSSGDTMREMTLGEPISVADGSLELVRVLPEKTEAAIPPGDYRFGFRFRGGL